MQCAILAGGLATRMRPATDAVPKALLAVAGRPFADVQLGWLADQGVDRVVYCIGHLGHQIRAHVGDGRRFGLDVTYSDEADRRLGTAGALRLAAERGLLAGRFLVLYGDSYLQIDVRAFWERFEASGLSAAMSVFHNASALERSNTRLDGDRVDLYRKGVADPASLGLDHVDYGLLAFRLPTIARMVPANTTLDLSTVQEQLSLARDLGAFVATRRYFEIGSPRGRLDLEAWLAHPGAHTVMEDVG